MTDRILLFGGCYSNLQATEALFAAAARLGFAPSEMFCTGDSIAYGADAAATLRLMRDAGVAGIAGNCEVQLAAFAADCDCGFAPDSPCSALASAWFAHAAGQMSDDDRRYMASLPGQLRVEISGRRILLVHGNVERINAFVFPSASGFELRRQLEISGCDVVIAGHSGIPFTRQVGGKLWHNTGSVGMPANDGTTRGWFSVLSVAAGEVVIESHALTYDAAAAAAAMRAARLPEGYAAALESGVWPSLDILPAAERLRTGVALDAVVAPAPVPVQRLTRLETLWVNTGTLCNLTCENCFMESSPRNDSLAYFSAAALREILERAGKDLVEIGFTGGEPFMNPEICVMLEMVLKSGRRALVLSNGMRPMQILAPEIAALCALYPGRLAVRVSLDHFDPALHEVLRGAANFSPALTGLKVLAALGAKISVAARTPWGQSAALMRGGFAELFAAEGILLDAWDAAALVLFPEMDRFGAPETLPQVTAAALKTLPPGRGIMCATSRMVVQRRGAAAAEYTPCTLLPARGLASSDEDVVLDHPHCAQFCVFGGASCAGAPG